MKEHTSKIIIALGLIVSAFIISISAMSFSNQGKYVEVKGLSEKIVKADQGTWNISMNVRSNDITDLYQQIDSSKTRLEAFFAEQGFSEEEVNAAPVNVYQDTYRDAAYRYNGTLTMSVFTDKVDELKSASEETLELIRDGIVFSSSYLNFEIEDINSVKPEMLEEAIVNARSSATQFASDSGTRLIGVSRANQGVFTITEKDPASPEYKKVRVVSTLRYMLK